MLKKILRRILFFLKSTNQHGVHSPFVYSFLTEGIYNAKNKYKDFSKKDRLLQVTLDYFQVQEVQGDLSLHIQLQSNSSYSSEKDNFKKLYYIKDLDNYTPQQLKRLSLDTDSDTLIYIHLPHCSSKAIENWKSLIANSKFHVSIDFYIAGVLATREGQRKEHFRLRV